LIIENFFLIAAPVTPAQIHAQENLRPILGLGAAGARVKHDNGVAPVIRAAEQLGQLGLRYFPAGAGDFRRGLSERIFAFLVLGDVEKKPRLFEIGAMLFPGIDDALKGGLLFENTLGFFRVVPKIGLAGNLG